MTPTRIEIDRILCPVDFSEYSSPALERAVRLGKWFGATVEALHVIPFSPLVVPAGVGPPHYAAPLLEVTKAQREQAEWSLDDLVAPFLGERVIIEKRLLEGDPWRVIVEEATAEPANLLVMGTHGMSGFARLLLGSVTEKVLRRAPCPVLTVGHLSAHAPAGGPLFSRILCAADLTRASEQTLEVALSLATESDAQITLLHVIETLPGDPGGRPYLSVPEIGPLRYELVGRAREELRKAVPDAARAFCAVTERVETGAPWSEILRVATHIDADLIVMGAHTRGRLGRWLFGSTASQVVRRAPCPVLVIQDTHKTQAAADEAEAVGAAVDRRAG